MRHSLFVVPSIAVLLLAAGCSPQATTSPANLAELRARLVLTEEPSGVLPVLAAVDALQADALSAGGSSEVLVLGRIGGVKNPCDATRAMFVMTDPSADIGAGADHVCNGDCHFCEKSKADLPKLAIVEIVDEQGQAYPFTAQQLADVAPEQMVVVRGRAKLDALGNLSVAASGIYVRR